MFLAIIGERPRATIASSSPTDIEPGDRWVLPALHEVWNLSPPPLPATSPVDAVRDLIKGAWLNDQIDYHSANAEKCHRRVRWLGVAVYVLFAATLVAAIFHLVGVPGDEADALSWPNAVSLFAIGLPAVAGAFGALAFQRQYERNRERSRGMARRLEEAVERLDKAATLDELRDIAWEIEDGIMLDETRDWFATMSTQDVRLHV